jgi:hypothetical protein
VARRAGAEYTVKRKMADGSIKEYRYARSGAKRTPARPDSIAALIAAYRASPQWKALKPRTKDHYARYTAICGTLPTTFPLSSGSAMTS